MNQRAAKEGKALHPPRAITIPPQIKTLTAIYLAAESLCMMKLMGYSKLRIKLTTSIDL